MKKILFLLVAYILSGGLLSQVPVHEKTFYRDADCIASQCFSTAMVNDIQARIDLLFSAGIKTNVIFQSHECSEVYQASLAQGSYNVGPNVLIPGTSNTSEYWMKVSPTTDKSYVLQARPGHIRLLKSNPAPTVDLNNLPFDFNNDTIKIPYSQTYYCILAYSLKAICEANNLSGNPPILDCYGNASQEALKNFVFFERDHTSSLFNNYRAYRLGLKQTYCSNLVIFDQYAIGENTKDEDALITKIKTQIGNDLLIMKPRGRTGPFFENLDVYNYSGSLSGNGCFPVSRDLGGIAEGDLIFNYIQGFKGNNGLFNRNAVNATAKFIRGEIMHSKYQPVPSGAVTCNPSANPGDTNSPGGTNASYGQSVMFPPTSFYGPSIDPITHGSHGEVTYFNAIDAKVVNDFFSGAKNASSHHLHVKYVLASGCPDDANQNQSFLASKSYYTGLTATNDTMVFWLYYNLCDKMYQFDYKLPDSYWNNMGSGFSVSGAELQSLKESVRNTLTNGTITTLKSSAFESDNSVVLPLSLESIEELCNGLYGTNNNPSEPPPCDNDENPWFFGVRPTNTPVGIGRVLSELFSIMKETVFNAELPERLWQPGLTDKDCLFDLPGAVVGVINGGLDISAGKVIEAASGLKLIKDVVTKKEVRQGVVSLFSKPQVLILGMYGESVCALASSSTCQEERYYHMGKLAVRIIFDLFSGSIVTGATSGIADMVGKMDNNLGILPDPVAHVKNFNFKKSLSKGAARAMDAFMGGLGDDLKKKLLQSGSDVPMRIVNEKIKELAAAHGLGNLEQLTIQQVESLSANFAALGVAVKGHFEGFLQKLPDITNTGFYDKLSETFAAIPSAEFQNVSNTFVQDINGTSNLVSTFTSNPKLITSWASLRNTTHRTNTNWLQRVSDWSDAGVKVVPDGTKTIVKNAGDAEIGQIINGELIPTEYATSGNGIGDPVNGYVVVDDAGSHKIMRKPNVAGYTTAQLNILQGNGNGHMLEKHGHDVPDEALIKRAKTGRAPDGTPFSPNSNGQIVIPTKSSKFESQAKVLEALTHVKPGSPAFNTALNANPANSDAFTVYVSPLPPTTFGYAYKVEGAPSTIDFGDELTGELKLVLNLSDIKARYVRDGPSSPWYLLTMYPD